MLDGNKADKQMIMYFESNESKYDVLRFVKSYRKKSFWKKEHIEYSFSINDGCDVTEEMKDMIMNCIRKDYPNAVICLIDFVKFSLRMVNHRFWVIAHLDKNNIIDGYYSGMKRKECELSSDISDAEISLDQMSIDETLGNIRKVKKEKFIVLPIYLNLVNGLLEPNFMITCTSKRGKQLTKYFARIEGNRLRLVNTSGAAMKCSYQEALGVFEYLQSHNKNFLYAVLPVFKDNVHCRNLEAYIKDKKISQMVALTTKLK